MLRRSSGILLHVTSLPSRYGIGDLGPDAYRFADFLAEAHQTCWQVLPLNPISASHGYSPYSSISTFAANPYLVSPDLMAEEGFISREDLDPVPALTETEVEYEGAIEYKTRLFEAAFRRFREGRTGHHEAEFRRFCAENAWWLDDFAMFSSLKNHFGGKKWSEWPEELRRREPAALAECGRKLAPAIEREKFVQFIFFRQWCSLKAYCNRKGIQIIGDIPIYVNYDSVDVWTLPHLFKLDENRNPVFVAGVPPDYFSATGQLWGNPVYDWDALRASGYQWWIKRMERMFTLYNVVRIDHFRGLVAYWEVPAHEKTAINGHWVRVPADDFFGALKAHFGELPIIVEDLGMITPDVRETAERFGFPGMKVLLFAFCEDNPQHPYLPHNYERNFVVYTGTHDTNTFRGWYDEEADAVCRARVACYLGHRVNEPEVHWDIVRLALSSVADLAILPMQDLLGLGGAYRMNKPATAAGNWRWRLFPSGMNRELAERLGGMSRCYGR